MNLAELNELLKDKPPINVSIDKEARAIYFKFSDEEIVKTARINSSLSVDLDQDKEVVGVEVIRIKKIDLLMKKALHDISSIISPGISAIASA